MTFKRYIFLTTILILFSNLLSGNKEPLTESRFQGVQKIEFNSRADGYEKITNAILQKISEANGSLRVFTSYDITYNINVELIRHHTESVVLKTGITDISIGGDNYYKHFRIDDILMPSKIKLDLVIYVNETQHIINYDYKLSEFTDGQLLLPEKSLDIKYDEEDKIIVSLQNILFYYDEGALNKFSDLEKSLYKYYESDKFINKITEALKNLQPANPDRVITDEFRFCEAEKLFWEIYHAPFWKDVKLEEKDPKDIKTRFSPLQDSIIKYRQLFNYYLSRIDETYYSRGSEQLKLKNYSLAEQDFHKAITYNPAHIPSYLSLTKLHLTNNEIDTATFFAGKVLSEFHPQGDLLDSTLYYTDKLLYSFFDNIDSLNREGKHTQAMHTLEEANNFCKAMSLNNYNEKLRQRFTDTHTGIYDSFLKVLDKAIGIANHSYAKTYINHTADYHGKHSEYIEDGNRVYIYLEKLIDRLIIDGRASYIVNDFRRAERLFYDALQLCNNYPLMDCSEDISKYHALAENARDEAELISLEITIKEPMPEIKDDDIIEKVKDEMLDNLSHGHLRAWAGDVREARRVLEDMTEQSAQYGLRRDSLINARLVSLSKRISQKECEHTERDINRYISNYNELVTDNEFIKANNMLIEAEKIYDNNPKCNIEKEKIEKEKNKIYPVIAYLDMMEELKTMYFSLEEKDYELFIKRHITADEFYQNNNIKDFGLKHKPLFEFAKNSSNQGFIIYSTNYFIDNQKIKKSLQLLYELKSLGVDYSRISSMQEQAGKAAAQYYSAIYPEKSHREILNDLTENDRWFRSFNRSFRRNWD